jgi:type IV pilus assembly protein PilV
MIQSRKRPAESGFTLLEVLVALVILSIGLLGVAKLILATQKSNDDASFTSKATVLGNAMLDDIRANFSNGNSAYYNVGSVGYGSTYSTTGVTNCVTTTCSSGAQIASSDILNWINLLSATLPNGAGNITVTTVGSYPESFTVATVAVTWNNYRAESAFENTCTATATSCTTTITLQSVIQ